MRASAPHEERIAMSDPNTTPSGKPVEEDTSVDDAVARANEGLADAEAAGRDAVAEPVVVRETVVERDVVEDDAGDPVVVDDVVVEETAWYDRPLEETPGAAAPEDSDADQPAGVAAVAAVPPASNGTDRDETPRDDAAVDAVRDETRRERRADADASTDSYATPADTYVAPTDAYVAGGAQPIFVQAPEAPRPRGNRGAAGAIGLLAAVVFAVLYLGVILAAAFAFGDVTGENILDYTIGTLTSWLFWTPVVAFFLGFWLLGAILNRSRWAHWVIWGLLVGVISYAGYILGVLLQAPFWTFTAREGEQLLAQQLFAPYAIVVFVLGRELTIWFGAWVAARGRRVTEQNEVAQREYERTLEAGPQLHQR
jgi:hypothetical protein